MVVVHVSLLFNNVFIFNPGVAIVFVSCFASNKCTLRTCLLAAVLVQAVSSKVNTVAHGGSFRQSGVK